MITDKYLKMMSEIGVRSLIRGKHDYGDELEMLMREHQQRRQQEASDIERELNIYRSGSAPPTIEGSLNGLIGGHGGVVGRVGLSEEEIRSDPAYIKYYYSHVNLNPRLPPPLFSKEDRRFSQRSVGGGGGSGNGSSSSSMVVGNRRPVNGVSVDEEEVGDRSMFVGKNMEKEIGMGLCQKSFAEIIQGNSESHHTHLQPNISSFDSNIHSFQKMGSLGSQTYASALGSSLSRSTTPDPQLVSKAPTSRIPQVVGSALGSDDFAQDVNVHGDLVSALSGLNLSANNLSEEGSNPNAQIRHQNMYHLQNDHNPLEKYSPSNKNESMQFHRSSLPYSSSYLRSPSTPLQYTGLNSPSQYPNFDSRNSSFSTFDLGTGVINPADIAAARSMGPDTRGLSGRLNSRPNPLTAAAELQNLIRVDNQMDPLYLQYSRSTYYAATQANSSMEMLKLQKSYLEWLLMQQNSQYGLPYANNPGGLNNGYYGNTANSLGLSYPGSMGSVLPHSPIGSGSPIWQGGDRNIGFSPGMMGAWDESFSLSLLDQFKSSKTKCFELSEIAGHVVEFSADQYGSRFIQQKLETASLDEKEMVYLEIMPHALSLMTDVFGNYVIQKFLEHGIPSHIRELADQLMGHVLELSLQMYGCRVIQKAIEVVDLDQKIKMVKELEGSVVRCVRDQNGNHVIQKCIECIPEDAIQFIVTTFYDQVVTFSSHPYGCRVIQRILENCQDPKTQSKVMDEVLQSVCMLAQDQYGNYVVQHVLEHGQPHERSTIISNFFGQIVQMSYQKFASNVVEKCLTFGSVEECQMLVNEMLGSTDENEPLQVMMKDQYANYVVQKVLETCDDQQLELILDRIKIHLNALKKYTYGKHIVARVEKLVAAGERRIGILASQSGQIS